MANSGSADLAGIDAGAAARLASAYAERGGQPGLAWGIVAGGRLVHVGGVGERWLGGPAPDENTVFRIASMTKSFTAAAVLTLRDEGALALADLAEQYVPELAGVPLPSADSPRPTIRNLLTMTGGFPSDDPWGDRQQGLPPAGFAALVRGGGVRMAWAPGTRFEYSNLGYAVLGRVIETVTGAGYADVIRARLLKPLGMTRTGFDAAEFGRDGLARGHQRGAGGWAELPFDPHGAFAPMGGIFSTVADLARWSAGFAAAFPPRDGAPGAGAPDGGAAVDAALVDTVPGGDAAAGSLPDAAHPLSRSSRREMQLPQLAVAGMPTGSYPDAPVLSYGFGLFVEESPIFGTMVQHSGGYPGFGSQMRWHPATGIGVIALGNGTYAAVGQLCATILSDILRRRRAAGAAVTGAAAGVVRGPAPGDGRPWADTLAARQAVSGLLSGWDDGVAERLFTPNVDLDQPLASRRADIGRVRERIGAFTDDPARPPEFDTPAHCRWWLRGERGTVQAEIGLAPLRPGRVQSLRLAVPPAGGTALHRVLGGLVAFINDPPAQWPATLPVAADLDPVQLARRLRLATAWAGPRCSPGVYRSGDGEAAVSVELTGDAGRAVLAVAIDPATGMLRQVAVTLLP